MTVQEKCDERRRGVRLLCGHFHAQSFSRAPPISAGEEAKPSLARLGVLSAIAC
jgi:hypothetical protein